MSRINELRQRKADLMASARLISETAADDSDRELTADEQSTFDGIMAKVAGVNRNIQREESLLDEERTMSASTSPAGSERQERTPLVQMRDLAADKPWGHDTGAAFGEFLLAIRNQRLGGPVDHRLMAAAQGAGEAIDADGGYLVAQDIITDLTKAINSGALLSRLTRIPLRPGSNGISLRVINETSRATGSRWGTVTATWVDEGTAPTASRPKFAKVDLKLAKIAALGYSGDELLDDAGAFERVITDAFRDELQFMVEDAVVNGDGAGKPLGILNAPALVTVAKETGQAAATIVSKNLSKMWSRFNGRNPVWFINRDCGPSLDELSIPAGTGALEPRFVNYDAQGILRIKGAPVVETEYNATLGTVGDIILADMSAYGYIDGGGVKQAQSMHVAFTTDEMAFRATMRCDGQVLPRSALTPFKGTGNTRSPFVVLATRA